MGAISGRTRRHRRHRLAAEMYCTWTPRRLFTFGTSVGWAHWFDNPNDLYRRRNRLTYSRDFSNAAWGKANILSVTADADGVGDLVVPNTTAASHSVSQGILTIGATSGSLSVRAKAGGYNFVVLNVGNTGNVWFNVSTGVVGTNASGLTASVSAASDAPGYFDCFIASAAAAAATTVGVFVAPADGGSTAFAADGTSGVYIARAQLETYTTTPTEYQDVPTTWPQAYLDAVGAERIYAWTDTAGTTPVTAIGDGIGLLLGREYGGARGSEMASANYATAATYDNVTTVVSATAFTQTAGTTLGRTYLNLITVVGKTYEVSSSITTTDASGVLLYARILPAGTGTILATSPSIASGGTARVIFTATTTVSSVLWSTQTVARIVNATGITVREIPGTHLTQATGTAKPTLSARVNLFTATEQFDSGDWTASAATVSANSIAAPNGTTTADKLLATVADAYHGLNRTTTISFVSGVSYRVGVFAKAAEYQFLRLGYPSTAFGSVSAYFDLSSGTLGTRNGGSAHTIQSVGNGWYWCTFTATATVTTVGQASFIYVSQSDNQLNYIGSATSGIYIWGADLRTADDAAKNIPAYQRVGATATDHDTDGFPHYALADGTDDCWASVATVDGSATDKLTHVTAVTKVSDAATGVVHEHGATVLSNVGTVLFQTAAATDWSINAYAGTLPGALVASPYAAPKTSVVAGVFDIASDLRQVHVDGVQKNTSNTDFGSGNFANATLYVLSRAGSSLRFNGRFYGSTGRFGPMGDSERNNLTRWWQKRIGTA